MACKLIARIEAKIFQMSKAFLFSKFYVCLLYHIFFAASILNHRNTIEDKYVVDKRRNRVTHKNISYIFNVVWCLHQLSWWKAYPQGVFSPLTSSEQPD